MNPEREFFPQVVDGVRKAWHRNALDAAIFWGKPDWAEGEAKALGLSEEKQREAVVDALFQAASREEIIHGNYDRAHQLTMEAFNLLRQKNPPEVER